MQDIAKIDLQILKEFRCFVLLRRLGDSFDANLNGFCSELDLYDVALLDIQGCFGDFAIHQYTAGVTCFVCDGAALDQAGYL